MAQVHSAAHQRRIQLVLQGQDSSGPWEQDLVVLALSNLLSNAIDFAPEGSSIHVDLEPGRVSVRDHGPGVPEALLGRLSERFFTTPRPNGERSGTGLGLSIVLRIMLLHGGSMQAANAHPGLRVTLNWPLRAH